MMSNNVFCNDPASALNACCVREENLTDEEPTAAGVRVRVCRVCRRKHYRATLGPARFAVRRG